METVFPFRESDRGDDHALLQSLRGIRNAVMLIRLRTEDTERVVKRKGQESFNYGDYFAYSKICTHLAARPRSTSSRRTASCARATSRSSMRWSTASRFSVPLLAHCRSFRLQ